MTTAAQPFSARIPHYQSLIETALNKWLPTTSDHNHLEQAMQYAALNGGKRLRPLLAYATAEVLKIPVERIHGIATAVELIHAYSLVHDDLPAMDDDDLRRGKPTTHIAFTEATAILAGDALQTRAFEIIATDPAMVNNDRARLQMIQELALAAGANGMCGGQAMDLGFEKKRPSQAELEAMFRGKTGRMITAPVVLAALSADHCDSAQLQALRSFADCAGLAFQIHDDILDIEANTEVLGKPQGSDAAQNKATWPLLFGLDAAKTRSRELYAESLEALSMFGDSGEPLRWLAAFIIERKY